MQLLNKDTLHASPQGENNTELQTDQRQYTASMLAC